MLRCRVFEGVADVLEPLYLVSSIRLHLLLQVAILYHIEYTLLPRFFRELFRYVICFECCCVGVVLAGCGVITALSKDRFLLGRLIKSRHVFALEVILRRPK